MTNIHTQLSNQCARWCVIANHISSVNFTYYNAKYVRARTCEFDFHQLWIILTSWHSIQYLSLFLCLCMVFEYVSVCVCVCDWLYYTHASNQSIQRVLTSRLALIVAVIQNLNYTLWMNLLSESKWGERSGAEGTENSGKRINAAAATPNNTWHKYEYMNTQLIQEIIML